MNIKAAATKEDINKCEKVIIELRPHLKGVSIWERYEKQLQEQFEILFIEVNGLAVAFIGYRIQHMLYSGKTLYIDDLCSLPEYRGNGYAGKLLDYVIDLAKKQACDVVSLDSGHHRFDAHRLYLNKRFKISAHHFQQELK